MTTKTLTKEEKLKYLKAKLAETEKKHEFYSKKQKEVDRKRRDFEENNKILFFNHPGKGYLGKIGTWEYNPIQKKYFTALKNRLNKIFLLIGANRIAKTFSGPGCTALTALRGRFPWEDESAGHWFWEQRGWKPPIKIRIVGQDWEKHIKTVLVPTLKELIPASWNVQIRKNNVGVEAYWTDMYGDI